MPFKLLAVPLVLALHVAPPLVVPRIVPLPPTAMQLLVLAQLTALSALVVPLVWALQVPPLLVARIVPPSPAAMQTVVLAQATPRSALLVPLVCALQVLPPFVD